MPKITEPTKAPGKTNYSGRRRDAVKKSGHKSHADATGGVFGSESASVYSLRAGEDLKVEFRLPQPKKSEMVGVGLYFRIRGKHSIKCAFDKKAATPPKEHLHPAWSKFGTLWKSGAAPAFVEFTISAVGSCEVSIYSPRCGNVWHDYFVGARESVLKNISAFSPEALFLTAEGTVKIIAPRASASKDSIDVKQCNRCARFLPVNFVDERATLSFSNHCVARSPCSHKGFGVLVDRDTKKTKKLKYGFQLECRFCKKFVVNAALNPMRTADQMKEDGQRRRHFELLLAELNSFSPQMHHRHKTGTELTDAIWKKFGKKCFNCDAPLATAGEMHIDHTLPLSQLWQLDETATSLCKTCNSQKRDRFPVDFYGDEKLKELSKITKIPLPKLVKRDPNLEALNAILARKEWLFTEFLERGDLKKERGGKITAVLVCKALDKVLSLAKNPDGYSFVKDYEERKTKGES